MPIWLIIILCLVLLIIVFVWSSYNSLVKLNERVEEAWSDITVQLKLRADLVPNLVETVKGYAKHEDAAITAVSDARAAMMGAKTVEATAEADKSFTAALSRLMMVSEAYPDLKANTNFQKLSSDLSDIEDKIQAARRFYNAGVKDINTKIKMFPVNLFGGFGFKAREYYNVEESERGRIEKAPEVKF